MGKLTVRPLGKIKAEIHVPGDKSISHRAIMIGSLGSGRTRVFNFLRSADCLATVDCMKKLGVEIIFHDKFVEIHGRGLDGLKPTRRTLNVGNSGTTIRLLAGILAGQPFITKITGDKSIQKRPMRRITEPLKHMGADIEGKISGKNIYAPLKISGGDLNAIRYDLPVASAQVKSAVLLAGLFAHGETVVVQKHPSRDHTERMLSYFGAKVRHTHIHGKRGFCGADVHVPGDISSAAFFMAAGLLVPEANLLIRDVGVNPTRTGILDVLHRMGANLVVKDERFLSEEPRANIRVHTSKLRGVRLHGRIIPRIIDEIPIIAVLATQAQGVTEITGARELRVKESDRIATISSELRKMGARVRELEDGLVIEGPTKLKGATLNSHGDHRIAMALAIAGLVAERETFIKNADCIETSFPGFKHLLQQISK